DQVYLMGLERHKIRRYRATTTLDRLGIDYKIFDAVDGRDLNSDIYNTDKVNLGEVGCHLTHKMIYQDALENGHDKICIFEDDIIPNVKANKLIHSIEDVPECNIVYLGSADWYIDDNIKNYEPENNYYLAERINSTHAYIITAEMMQEALELFNK